MADPSSSPPRKRDRVSRIPLEKIEKLDPCTNRNIAIFFKASSKSATQTIYDKFPKDAAKVFSDRLREDITAGKAVVLDDGNGQRDVQAFKDVFDWIKDCVSEKKCVYFKTLDESTPKLLSRYAKAINAADYLGIPARDFSEGLSKRLFITTKKVPMMEWDEIEFFYTKLEDTLLRTVAAHSIFWAWWNKDGRLGGNDEVSGDDLAHLATLRQDFPLLDEDLHERCKQNESDVTARREAKREDRRKQESADSGGGWGGDSGYGGSSGAAGGWDDQGDAVQPASTDWENVGLAEEGWDKENTAPSGGELQDLDGEDATGGVDWADEVNAQEQLSGQW